MVLMKAYQHDGRARAAPWAFETLLLMGTRRAPPRCSSEHRFNQPVASAEANAESTTSAVEQRGPGRRVYGPEPAGHPAHRAPDRRRV